MILSHLQAGSGVVMAESREEARFVRSTLGELPSTSPCMTIAAPGGPLKDARTGKATEISGVANGYAWLAGGPGRCLIVFDAHMLINNPGFWRAIIEALPGIRSPIGARDEDPASLAVFVAPSWNLESYNPLRGAVPILTVPSPTRAELHGIASRLAPLKNGDGELVVDALCGLSADSAEQAAAECLAAKHKWDSEYLRNARRQMIREAGLELWPVTSELGGLGGLREFTENELLPWVRDDQLSVRRVLCAGLPGTGKSYFSRWLAYKLKCECCRLSVSACKAGIVGASEQNLKRALRSLDALGKDAPIVCVIDEIDTIAREGLDGGTSSGMFAELLTWLQESQSQCVVVATLNRLDKLDAALESRFQARLFFDLPTLFERQAIARIHYFNLGSEDPEDHAQITGLHSAGFSAREIAEYICPSVCRRTSRNPTAKVIEEICAAYTPASKTQQEQIDKMRTAASSLRRANDPEDESPQPGSRKITKKQVVQNHD
jgi:hypothetical protein